MTVKQLIEKLQEYPKNTVVQVLGHLVLVILSINKWGVI